MGLKEDLLAERIDGHHPSLVETHISWVFLGATEVFKVKRPVDLGFLDFTTLERRKAACEAEVELNRRLAPDVYRGVVPVRRDERGRHSLGGEGAVVDFAVHMRRLPDARRADLMVCAGQLNGTAVDAIAARLARFHERAALPADPERFGAPAAISKNVEESLHAMEGALTRYLSTAEAAEILTFQRDTLRQRAEVFERRISGGHIRDGHGDLRLEHVYLERDRDGPTIIDCIEFSDRFRYGDVCADIAFLAMDLAEHGRADLSERFLASYAREANDFEIYALVDFYSSYRAFIRGKIGHLLANDPEVSLEIRERAESEARRCFLLALAAARRPMLAPTLIAVGGVIASGKSTLSEAIATELSAPIVEADRTRKDLMGVKPLEHLTEGAFQGAYDLSTTENVYREVLRRADVILSSGRPVVVDASFRSAERRRDARALAQRQGVPFRLIECRVDLEICRERLVERERHAAVSDGRSAIFDAFCASFEPIVELPVAEHVVVDTSRPLEVSLAELRETLQTWPPGLVG